MNLRKQLFIDKINLIYGSEAPQDENIYYFQMELYNPDKRIYKRIWTSHEQLASQDIQRDKGFSDIKKTHKRVTNKKFLYRLLKCKNNYITVELENDP